MVDLAKLDELIARVEKATGGDSELDRDIAIVLGWTPPALGLHHWHDDHGNHWSALPDWSTSIDAALGLVERMLPGAQVGLDPIFFVDPEAVRWDAIICIPDMSRWNPVNSDWIRRIEARHDARVLAIILALLKALREASHDH